MLIAERFISGLVRIHGKHPVSTDGGTWFTTGLQVPKTRSPYPFPLGEKSHRKDDAVHQGQDRKF